MGRITITKRGCGLVRQVLYLFALRMLQESAAVRAWYEKRRGYTVSAARTPFFSHASRSCTLRRWTRPDLQHAAGCSSVGSGGGTVRAPISRASSAGSRRARVAAQYLGASSRCRSLGQCASTRNRSRR